MNENNFAVVVPWHNEEQISTFLKSWKVEGLPKWLILQQDKHKHGCARTKNRGIDAALENEPEYICVIDDDCLATESVTTLEDFAKAHISALQPREIDMFEVITDPPSRGTPYFNHRLAMPVAASLGFWQENGDYDAVGQLVHGKKEMTFKTQGILYGKYFAFSGMNFAFHHSWTSWARLVNIPRWDDILMGWLWQKKAYSMGYCFNLGGPIVRHSRQSNVWQNLRDEVKYMEEMETLWQKIAQHSSTDYNDLAALLPRTEPLMPCF